MLGISRTIPQDLTALSDPVRIARTRESEIGQVGMYLGSSVDRSRWGLPIHRLVDDGLLDHRFGDRTCTSHAALPPAIYELPQCASQRLRSTLRSATAS